MIQLINWEFLRNSWKGFLCKKVKKRKLSPRKGFCLDSWNLFRGDAASFQTCTSERLEDIFTFLSLIRHFYFQDLFRCGRTAGVIKMFVTILSSWKITLSRDFWNLFLSTFETYSAEKLCASRLAHLGVWETRDLQKKKEITTKVEPKWEKNVNSLPQPYTDTVAKCQEFMSA